MKKSMRETVSKEALASAPAANDDETSELMAQAFQHSFEKLCLSAGLRAFQDMMAQEVAALCGARHQRQDERQGRRWGTTRSRVPYHGGEVPIERPRVAACRVADQILIPCRPGYFDIIAIKATVDVATIAGKTPAIVINGSRPNSRQAADAIGAMAGLAADIVPSSIAVHFLEQGFLVLGQIDALASERCTHSGAISSERGHLVVGKLLAH